MATLPSRKDLGMATVSPSLGVASYRGDSGQEGTPGRLMQQAGGEFDKVGEILQKAREEQAKTEAEDALNQYQEKLTGLAYDENGWTNTKGGAANVEFSKKTSDSFETARKQVEEKLKDPLAKDWFKRHAQPVTLRSHSALLQHVSKEQTAYRSSVYEKGIALRLDNINKSFGNDESFNTDLMAMAFSSREYAKSLGLPDDAASAAVSDIVDKAWKHRIKAALNADDVERASDLYKQAKNGVKLGSEVVSISTSAREEIDTMLKPAIRGNKEMKVSNEVWDKLGPKGRNDPVQIEPMMDALREKYPNESAGFFSNARTMLTQRAADRDTDIQKADGKSYGVLQEALSSGKKISELQKMPEWAAVTPAHHAALQDKAKADAFQAISRAAASEGRAYQAELREFNRIKMADEKLTFNGYGATYELMTDPARLMAMSDEELTNKALTLGQQNVNRLRQRKEQLKNPVKTEINQELFTAMADEAGLKASLSKDKRGAENNMRLIKLREAVDTEVQQEAAKKGGHPLTNEEAKVVMQRVLDRKVMVDEWGRDPMRSIATILPEEIAKVYVPIAEIPQDFTSQAIRYMKSVGKIPQGMSDAAAMNSYRSKIEKAYGARQIPGVTREAIDAILKE